MADRTETLLVHAGCPKTGTSVIQSALFALREALAERSLFYPDLTGFGFGWQAERGTTAGNGEIHVTEDPAVDEDRWQHLLNRCAETSSGGLQVMSSETIALLLDKEFFWRALAAHAADTGREARVVVYLRDPFPYVLSTYSQAVKSEGCTGTFAEWVDALQDCWWFRPYFHLDLIDELARRHGCRLDLFRYEDARADIVRHFVETVCGVSIDGLSVPDRLMNPSLTAYDCSFHRGVNSQSSWIGKLLAWERTDSQLQCSHLSAGEPGRFELGPAGVATLDRLFAQYRSLLARHADFADRVDYSVDRRQLTEQYTPEEAGTHLKFFELGRIVANSCTGGYISWDFEQKAAANAGTA